MEKVEKIVKEGIIYAISIRSDYKPDKTEFFTEDEHFQQLGFIVYEAGGQIKPHMHKVLKRTIDKTTETLIVKKGKIEYQIFNNDEDLISTGILKKDDIITLINGGHGFKIIEDAIMIEVKQGPFISTDQDKKRFQ